MDKSELKKRKVSIAEEEKPILAEEEIEKVKDELPFKGKVFLARKKKPDSWIVVAVQMLIVAAVFGLIAYSYYYFDHVHFHIANTYANLGYDTAQHHVAHKYLHGIGVDRDENKAMEWYKKAADQGHPHAAYNLAIGHLKGLKSGLQPGEARKLIEHAAKHNVPEAHRTLHHICNQGGCDDD